MYKKLHNNNEVESSNDDNKERKKLKKIKDRRKETRYFQTVKGFYEYY